jgi:hypothetical protein
MRLSNKFCIVWHNCSENFYLKNKKYYESMKNKTINYFSLKFHHVISIFVDV